MKIVFIGAAHEVTGSCHYIECGGKHMLVDCGMRQGRILYENQSLPVPESEIDYVFLTHAHIDHSGLLPLLAKRGFKGQIFTTKATRDLASIMLRDSAHIQEIETQWKNRKEQRAGKALTEAIYTMEDALVAIEKLVPCDYAKVVEVCNGISIRFTDVGHLLGSACVEVFLTEGETSKTVAFSGDVGNIEQPIIKNPGKIKKADYVVIESTYGDRDHGEEVPDYVTDFTQILREAFQKGGNVVIPSFAVGRTQELLYFIREIKEKKMLPEFQDFEVYLDSPLAIEATRVFQDNVVECFDEEALQVVKRGVNPLVFDGLQVSLTADDSKAINFLKKPVVIISASGMCDAGRIRHHLKHNLWRPECTVLFVGYQANQTLGRNLIEGAKTVKIFGETIQVEATIKSLKGISGHGDRKGLLDWLSGFDKGISQVCVVHGDDQVTDAFASLVTDTFDVPAFAPYSGGSLDLITNQVIQGEPVFAKEKAPKGDTGLLSRILELLQSLLVALRLKGASIPADKLRGMENQMLAWKKEIEKK